MEYSIKILKKIYKYWKGEMHPENLDKTKSQQENKLPLIFLWNESASLLRKRQDVNMKVWNTKICLRKFNIKGDSNKILLLKLYAW